MTKCDHICSRCSPAKQKFLECKDREDKFEIGKDIVFPRVKKEGKYWIAYLTKFPIVAQGKTKKEALKILKELMVDYFKYEGVKK